MPIKICHMPIKQCTNIFFFLLVITIINDKDFWIDCLSLNVHGQEEKISKCQLAVQDFPACNYN
jgi:hypothetical protein